MLLQAWVISELFYQAQFKLIYDCSPEVKPPILSPSVSQTALLPDGQGIIQIYGPRMTAGQQQVNGVGGNRRRGPGAGGSGMGQEWVEEKEGSSRWAGSCQAAACCELDYCRWSLPLPSAGPWINPSATLIPTASWVTTPIARSLSMIAP